MNISRKKALERIALTGAGIAGLPLLSKSMSQLPDDIKSGINHSVCQWCFSDMPLEDLVIAAKGMGIKSIDLLRADEWKVAIKHGLTCAMGYASPSPLTVGFNDTTKHAQFLADYSKTIPLAAEAGITNLICFSGNARGMSKEQGLENCAKGLDPILKVAAKYNITISMELLNSKVDHHDYQCDYTEWGVKLCEKLGSENFKLLYDIYHMQIMEGNVIATIRQYSKYISHYHTAGVPGRNEIDETQELNYPAIMRAIVQSGFKGYVAQEFMPAKADKLASLKQAVDICSV